MTWVLALRPLAGIAAIFGAAMLALGVLLASGVEYAIVPTPENEAETAVRNLHRGFPAVRGELLEKDRTSATVEVQVRLHNGTQETIELPLEKEHGLWRVASVERLGRLTR